MPPKPDPLPECSYGADPAAVQHTFVASTTAVQDREPEERTNAMVVTFCSRCGTVREARAVVLA